MNTDFLMIIDSYVSWISDDKQDAIIKFKNINYRNFTKLNQLAAFIWLASKMNQHHEVISMNQLEELVERLKKSWNLPNTNIMNNSSEGIYTSNLGMVYSALKEYKFFSGKNIIQKDMTEIRDYIFNHLLKERTLIGEQTNRVVMADQLLTVMPFGLFAPEDLIVVEATKALHHEVTENPFKYDWSVHVLLGLYYCEKFELDTSEKYFHWASEMTAETTSLHKLLSFNLKNKRQDSDAVSIIHQPFGNGNVYERLAFERIPAYPELGENFLINAKVVTNQKITDVEVVFPYNPLIKTTVMKQENEQIWSTSLTFSQEFENEKYIIRVKTVDKSYDSETYLLNGLYLNEISLQVVDDTVFFEDKSSTRYYLGEQAHGLAFQTEEINLHSKTIKLLADVLVIENDNQEVVFTLPLENGLKIGYIQNKIAQLELIWTINELPTRFIGFGERYNSLNQYGNKLDCFVYNQYRDQGTKTYMPMPYFVTDKSIGMFIRTDHYTHFDVGATKENILKISIQNIKDLSTDVAVQVYKGNPKKIVTKFGQTNGKAAMLPAWALGPWMSSNNWDRDQVVREQVEITKELSIPATVIVLEQWSDETSYYMFNDVEVAEKDSSEAYDYDEMTFPEWGRWPDPKGLIDYCHDKDLKFILWQIPIMKYLNQQNEPLKDRDEKYMIEKGYCVHNADGTPYRIPENWFTDSLLMDFSNPEGAKWWFDKRKYLLDIGVDGFKTDGGEMVYGNDVVFSDGRNGDVMRNQYPNDYVRAYYNFAQENNGITFSRSSYLGAHQFPAHWAGDERSTYDALKRTLIAGLNSGMSNVIFWGWDLAGFNGEIPTAELFIRSTQMATFCPIMQYHAESKAEFNQDRTPWNIAERRNAPEVISIYRYFANLRMNLLPYIYDQATKSTTQNLPMMRTLSLEFPKDEKVWDIIDEYLYGENLLIAPVIEEGARSRKVYFPGDKRWIDIKNYEVFEGGTEKEIAAPLEEIPVFMKENSALLLNLDEDLTLGSNVGSSVEKYHQLKLIVCCSETFNANITDHLGNKHEIAVIYEEDSFKVKIENTIQQEIVIELITLEK